MCAVQRVRIPVRGSRRPPLEPGTAITATDHDHGLEAEIALSAVSVRQAGVSIARICRGMSYDQFVQAAAEARRRLGLRRPKDRRRVVARLSRAEVDQVLSAAYTVGGARGLMIKTLLLTGCRVSEFCHLEVEDFRYDQTAVIVRRGKGDKDRIVPILPALADELRVHVGPRAVGPLFANRSWRPFSPRRVQTILAEVARAAGIGRRVYPHLMRHTVAQLLLDGGMPLEQVSRFLGHAHVTTTQIYAESSPAQIATSYRKALG